MGILKDGADLAYHNDFRRMATAAAAYVASEVLGESESTPDYDARQFMARQVLLNPEGFEGYFAWLCAVHIPIAGVGAGALTEEHEGLVLERITELWTFAARFYYGEQFPDTS